ncbi:nitroreductase family protein [Marinobacterium sediminicola]|uniref:Putative NAD(P)H nitroreductase n=1 Tax=Marinobacterium sediminicola TaxID=518898 RepID=A0ABY1S0W2_9GAMM|nr:nitroreductase family protein [Marinobacterium sediminicola]ULG68356.1 nitroreductase family protein [Marinobacterium sediminicola]SMR74765.1 Nitroreductase [Marinobacterium sediminicola]
MEALDALINRVSSPRLEGPAPSSEQLEQLLKAALRAPDHGALRPWRFIITEGEGLVKLGRLYADAARADDPELADARYEKYCNMPLRAPMVITVVAVTSDHPKVPISEQLISAGCAAHSITQVAYAMGLGAMWRTGEMAYHPRVKQGLGLLEGEEIVGYLYLGQKSRDREAPQLAIEEFVTRWQG